MDFQLSETTFLILFFPIHSNYISSIFVQKSILIISMIKERYKLNNNPPNKTSYGNNFNFKKVTFNTSIYIK